LQVVYLLIVLFIAFWIITHSNPSFSTKKKIVVSVLFLALISLVVFYENKVVKEGINNRNIINAFNQDRNITCKATIVNKSKFDFMSGSLSFIANKNNTKQQGLVVPVESCSYPYNQ
jgi:hypothetical protein